MAGTKDAQADALKAYDSNNDGRYTFPNEVPTDPSAPGYSQRENISNSRRWVVGNGCCDPINAHRGATLSIDGTVRVPERFAIDFIQQLLKVGANKGIPRELSWAGLDSLFIMVQRASTGGTANSPPRSPITIRVSSSAAGPS